MTRLQRVRDSGDQGSALAIALVFLMVFGLLIGVVLQFATAGQRTAVAVQDEATSTYAGGGALEGAINAVRGTSEGSESVGLTTCFSLPASQLGNTGTISVSCQPRPGSGGDSATELASQPGQAVLARSTNAAEGVAVGAGTSLTVSGRVLVNKQLKVPGTGTLRSTGPNSSIQAGDCTAATGTVAPACATATVPGDPGWGAPIEYPAMRPIVPACNAQARVVTLSPGTYLSASALQAILTSCTTRVIWFQPGTYYFDFRDALAATRELKVPNAAVVVGGTPLGWVPNTTLPASVPVPTAAQPTRSACDVSQRGVEFVFAGDSRLSAQAGADIQLCAEETGNTDQHVVLRGLASQSAALPAAQPTAGGATAATTAAGAGTAWTQPDEGAIVDGTLGNGSIDYNNVAYVVAAANSTSRALRVGPFPTELVPPEATNVAVTVTLTGGMLGPGTTSVRLTNGTTLLTTTPMRTCPPAGCNDTTLHTDTVTISGAGLTPAIVNSMYVDALISSGSSGSTTGAVDGITISVDFTAPMRATSGTGVAAPYVTTQTTTTTPILRTAGAFPATVVALHGTVDAQAAAVDLGVTSVPYVVVDRGLAVRHLQSSMTLAAGYTGPLISVPALSRAPRRVLLEAKDPSSVVLARADVTFGNAAGAAATTDGAVPTVNEWSVG